MKYKFIFNKKNDPADRQIAYLINHIDRLVFSLDSASEKKYFVAGGAIRDILLGSEPRDFDIYFEDESEQKRIVELYKKAGGVVVRESPNTQTLSMHLQPTKQFSNPPKNLKFDCIRKTFGTVHDILDSFDFTICCAAVKPGVFHHHSDFFQHLLTKSLYFNCIQNDVVVIRRMAKYLRKGYFIDSTELVKAIECIRNAKFDAGIKEQFLKIGADYGALQTVKEKEDEAF